MISAEGVEKFKREDGNSPIRIDLDDKVIDHLLETWINWYEKRVFEGKTFDEIFKNNSNIKDSP